MWTLIFLLSLIGLSSAQTNLCFYQIIEGEYGCELLNGQYVSGGEFNIIGNHLPGYVDSDVLRVKTSTLVSSNFQEIPNALFSKFMNLTHLDLRNSSIQGISQLELCQNLESLYLDSNQISVIAPEAFINCANLIRLTLSNNRLIGTLNTQAFSGLTRLQYLSLNNNLLANVGNIQQLLQLREVYFQFNQILSIPDNAFGSLSNLETINLMSNEINSISSASLIGLRNLKYLYINDNRINRIEVNAFSHVPNLMSLNLQGNLINVLNSTMFGVALPSLYELSLRDNQIEAIQRNFFNTFPSLERLNFVGNLCFNRDLVLPAPDFDSLFESCFSAWELIENPPTFPPSTELPTTQPPTTAGPTTTTPSGETTTEGGAKQTIFFSFLLTLTLVAMLLN